MLNTEGFSWTSYARTDVGKVRKVNEDAVLDHGSEGIWVVADGMGGHAAGDVASSSVVESLKHLKSSDNANSLVSEIEERLININDHLIQQSSKRADQQTMGSTVVVLLAFHQYVFLLWAGDSRIYRLREGQLKQITVDHSKVQEMIDDNLIDVQEAETHPQANVITRAIGACQPVYIDLDMYEVASGDRYMLCSDGLYKEVSESEMATLIAQGSPENACNALVDLTLERGSRDNVTVTVVQAD